MELRWPGDSWNGGGALTKDMDCENSKRKGGKWGFITRKLMAPPQDSMFSGGLDEPNL